MCAAPLLRLGITEKNSGLFFCNALDFHYICIIIIYFRRLYGAFWAIGLYVNFMHGEI